MVRLCVGHGPFARRAEARRACRNHKRLPRSVHGFVKNTAGIGFGNGEHREGLSVYVRRGNVVSYHAAQASARQLAERAARVWGALQVVPPSAEETNPTLIAQSVKVQLVCEYE